MSKARLSNKKNKKESSNEEEEDEEFEVEKILDSKYNAKIKATEYLVKWKGWSEDDSTWEPIDNLQNVIDMVHEYDRMQKKKDGPSGTSARHLLREANKKSLQTGKSAHLDEDEDSKKNQSKKAGPAKKKVASEQELPSSEEDQQEKKDTHAEGSNEGASDELVFEKIVSKRQAEDGLQYLIKFQNIKEAQWIDECQLGAIKEDIQQFEEKQAANSKSKLQKEVKKTENANSDAEENEDNEDDAMKERKKKLVPPSQRQSARRSQPFVEDEKKLSTTRSSSNTQKVAEKELPKKNHVTSNSNLNQPTSSSSLEQSSKVVNKLRRRPVQEDGDAPAGDFQTDNIEKIEILGEYTDILSARFEVFWKARKDGVSPLPLIYSASYLRRYEPTVLVDFMINNSHLFMGHQVHTGQE